MRARIYYTEYPDSKFMAISDKQALEMTNAKLVYRESDTPNGVPFKILRDLINGPQSNS